MKFIKYKSKKVERVHNITLKFSFFLHEVGLRLFFVVRTNR